MTQHHACDPDQSRVYACNSPNGEAFEREPRIAPIPFAAIATCAYYRFVRQGSHPGHDVQHWLEAERELRAERQFPG